MTTCRSMRITVLVDVFPALSETFVLDQVVSLIERGHDVSIIADKPRNEPAVHEDVARHGLLRRTRYLAPPHTWRGRLAVLAHAARQSWLPLARTMVALQLAHWRVGEVGSLRMLALVAALAEAPRPDIILCHFGPNGSLATRALDALGWATPVVTIFHGFDLSRLVKQRGPHLYDHLFEKGCLFLPACEGFADLLRSIGCPPERIMVQRMCADLPGLDAIAASLDGVTLYAAFTFVGVGRLVPKKGLGLTIRAFARAFGHLPASQVSLLLAGDGPLRTELEAIVQEAGVAGQVEFLGPLQRRAIVATMLAADVLVQASATAADGDMESMPLVISEAMALGKPILGTRHSGIPELVLDGVTGHLLDEGDEAGLAAAMAWMVANRQAAAQMGQAGRARLKAGFTAKHWNTLLEQRLQHVVFASEA